MRSLTRFPELDEVVTELSRRAESVLGDTFVGAYLQGSFALGDADEHSDVDFLIVTDRLIAPGSEAALRAMHAEFPQREVEWARHLEGSYATTDAIRVLDECATPWLYVDNGARVMELSAHDNTAVTRWVLREHGVTLTGPEPSSIVDPVTADDLRSEVRATVPRWAAELRADPAAMDNAWTQPHTVLAFCRALHTVADGRVASKRESGEWAIRELDAGWQPLIQRALDDRPAPWDRVHRSARPWTLDPTWAFITAAIESVEAAHER